MLDRVGDLIDRSLNTRVTPLAYLIVALGLIRGIAYTFFQTAAGVKTTVTSQVGTVIPLTLWGIIVLSASSILLVGLFVRSVTAVMVGSLFMALTWGCNLAAYAMNGYFEYLFPYSIISTLMYGYFFITAPIGRLWDYTPVKG